METKEKEKKTRCPQLRGAQAVLGSPLQEPWLGKGQRQALVPEGSGFIPVPVAAELSRTGL